MTALLRTVVCLGLVLVAGRSGWSQTSTDTPRLKQALVQYPQADGNGDGVLTLQEARAYLREQRGAAGKPAAGDKPGFTSPEAEARRRTRPVFETEIFQATAEQLDAAMQADSAANRKEPLHFPKGTGLRIVSTGHSWVAPAMKTLPDIAVAAGYSDQHLRFHTSGGGTGSANSIWRKELGRYGDDPPRTILLPAIGTGAWDVMTWGMYFGDVPEHYTQWMDVCLAKNPEMVFYLQDGWPTYGPELQGLDKSAALERIDARQAEIQTLLKPLYDELQERYPDKVRFIPAGAAVCEMLHRYHAGQLPELDCVSEHLGGSNGIYRDGGHLSRTSGLEWLDGYIYFATLYGESPERIRDWRPQGVPENIDRAMRAAAWKATCGSPFSGVTDVDRDGIDDDRAPRR